MSGASSSFEPVGEPGRPSEQGRLRVYLGAAPGVGKTFAMLDEAHRRRERGTDVVVGLVETHGRARTAERLTGLEVIPRRSVVVRGALLTDLDTDAVLARRPDVVLVDELAHTNAPGGRHAKRWQDVEELLAAGIDVVATVNIQHLESLNDVVAQITGITQRETVPDAFVRRAEQVELVDMSPEALRRRMTHGNVYPADRIDAALANYFRPGNLGALRELSLLWLADRVEAGLEEYRSAQGITARWETRERVVVALTAQPGGEGLIRRAARLAARARGELIGVHVRSGDGLRERSDPAVLERHRVLLEQLGGTYHELASDDISRGLVSFATARKATQLVLGSSGRSWWSSLTTGSIIDRTIRDAGGIDVHVIARDTDGTRLVNRRTPRRITGQLPPRRVRIGWLILAVGLPLLTLIAKGRRDDLGLATELLAYLGIVVAAAAVGGVVPAIVGAITASLVANFYLIDPIHTFAISNGEHALALFVFVAIAATVSGYVTVAATRTHEARQARAEAEALARAMATLVGAPDPLPTVLEQLQRDFGASGVAIFRVVDSGATLLAGTGDVPASPEAGQAMTIGDEAGTVLVMCGADLDSEDELLLHRRVDQVSLAIAGRERQLEAGRLAALEQIDSLRTAMLHAVSHDLRTPLTSIKAAVTSLLARDVHWSPAESDEFLETIDDQTDRLTRLVENLLDMSRLEAGVLTLRLEPVAIDDIVTSAVPTAPSTTSPLTIDIPDDLPFVRADPALLERVVANVVSNAMRYSPPDLAVRLEAEDDGGRVTVRVIDHGPGIPETERSLVLQPFQRLGDRRTSNGPGVGLGLAVADGFTSAMGGTLSLTDTPGGGLTVELSFEVADPLPQPSPATVPATRTARSSA